MEKKYIYIYICKLVFYIKLENIYMKVQTSWVLEA